jgi:hypothetical protein
MGSTRFKMHHLKRCEVPPVVLAAADFEMDYCRVTYLPKVEHVAVIFVRLEGYQVAVLRVSFQNEQPFPKAARSKRFCRADVVNGACDGHFLSVVFLVVLFFKSATRSPSSVDPIYISKLPQFF